MRQIRRAVVLGSGVMGAAIAGHLANVGVDCDLLDLVPETLTDTEKRQGKTTQDPKVRNRWALQALRRLQKDKPAPIYTEEVLSRIQAGNMTDDWAKLSEVDWIIEAVVEDLNIKQQLMARIEKVWQSGTIVSSNTSGISVSEMVADRSKAFQRHFMGTHFFNPPRYMKLLEMVPTSQTDPQLLLEMQQFAERQLGKGVVVAKDTPNFIANRIGVYGLLVTLTYMLEHGLTPDQVDEVTGPLMGRPKSATFRTLDLVGLDTFIHVADNVRNRVSDPVEKEIFQVPELVRTLVKKGWLGEKSGQGFYRKVKDKSGSQILSLHGDTMDYQSRERLQAPSLQAAKRAKTLTDKLHTLLAANDPAGKLAWYVVKKSLLYSAQKASEMADSILDIDRAMRWGFNWQMGPFEIWDAIGVKNAVERMKQEGERIPNWVERMLANGRTAFYERQNDQLTVFHQTADTEVVAIDPRVRSLTRLKEDGHVVKANHGASLVDLGDDVLCLEFHSPNNAIGPDILEMVQGAVQEVTDHYRGLVIGNQGRHFCVGANLMLILMEAQDDNWTEVDAVIRRFQEATMALKSCPKPVVAAPFAMAVGGGAEICFPADLIQAAAETYMGLVEVGVGLIPAGGGTKELLIRATEGIDPTHAVALQAQVNQVFERIGLAKVSTSAADARRLGFLRAQDRFTVNGDHLLYEAKQAVLSLDRSGYVLPQQRRIPVVGETGYNVMKWGAYSLYKSGRISAHDYKISDKLAFVLAGGNVSPATFVTEQYLLELEREAFLSLCGEPKTQARMQHMLATNKPLRN